jgi:heat shock protein HtpX
MTANLEETSLNLGKNLDFQRFKLKLFFAATLLVLTGSLVLVVSILSGGSRFNALLILIGFGIFYAYETNKEFKKLTSNPSLEHPDIMEMVHELSKTGGIPVPDVLTTNEPVINAYALSTSKKSYIILPRGIIESFDNGTFTKEELKSILAHEIGHIINKDSLIKTGFLFIFQSLTTIQKVLSKCEKYISRITKKTGELTSKYGDDDLIGIPLIAFTFAFTILLIVVAISSISLFILITVCVYFTNLLSRQMEYIADLISASLTKNPLALAEALHNITKIDLSDIPESNISLYQSPILNKKTTDLKDIKPSFKERLSEYSSTHPNLINRIDMLLNPKGCPKSLLTLSDKLNLLNLKHLQLKELPVIDILNWKIPLSNALYQGILVGLFLGISSIIINYFTVNSFIDYIVFILGALWIGLFSLSRSYPEGSSISTSSFDTMMKVIFVVALTYSIITNITVGVISYYSTIFLGIILMAPVSLLT